MAVARRFVIPVKEDPVGEEDRQTTTPLLSVTGRGLAKQKQPELVRIVEALPTNPTGKVNKKAVKGLFATETEG